MAELAVLTFIADTCRSEGVEHGLTGRGSFCGLRDTGRFFANPVRPVVTLHSVWRLLQLKCARFGHIVAFRVRISESRALSSRHM